MEPQKGGEASDSDISDDWNVIESKEAVFVSESESIEVIEGDEFESGADDEADEEEKGVSGENIRNRKNVKEEPPGDGTSRSQEQEGAVGQEGVDGVTSGPASDPEQLGLDADGPTTTVSRYNLSFNYPEEGRMPLQNRNAPRMGPLKTHDLIVSFSIIMICIAVASFIASSGTEILTESITRYYNTDSLSFFGQKDTATDFKSKEIAACERRYKSAETKLDHIRLAVKALEENSISLPAFIEFVADIDRPSSSRSSGRQSADDDTVDFGGKSSTYSKFTGHDGKIKDGYRKDRAEGLGYDDERLTTTLLLSRLSALFETSDSAFKHHRNNMDSSVLGDVAIRLSNNKEAVERVKQKFTEPTNEATSRDLLSKIVMLDKRLHSVADKINLEIADFFQRLSNRYSDTLKRFEDNFKKILCHSIVALTDEFFRMFCRASSPKLGKGEGDFKEQKWRKAFRKSEEKDTISDDKEGERSKSPFPSSYVQNSGEYRTDGDTAGKERKYFSEKDKRRISRFSKEEDDDDNDFNDKKKYRMKRKFKIDNVDESSSKDISEEERKRMKYEGGGDKRKINKYERKRKDVNEDEDDKEKRDERVMNKEDKNGWNKNSEYSGEKRLKYRKDNKNETQMEEGKKPYSGKLYAKNRDGYESEDNNVNKYGGYRLKKNFVEMKYEEFNEGNEEEEEDNVEDKNRNSVSDNKDTENNNFIDQFYAENVDGEILPDGYFLEKIADDSVVEENVVKDEDEIYNKEKHREKFRKLTPEELILLKKDVLSSLHGYIEGIFDDLKEKKLDENIAEKLMNATYLPGDWFLSLGRGRDEKRRENSKSDWVFDRAGSRDSQRREGGSRDDISLETQWFFRRAWERQQCRSSPNSPWCRNVYHEKPLNLKSKFSDFKTFKYLHKNR